MKAGNVVHLPTVPSASEPNGPRALEVHGTVLEIAGELAFVRWDRGPDLSRCGVGGGWYEIEELRVVGG